MAKIYPPTDQFRFLSPDEQAVRLDAAEDMLALMQFWRGDPRLSSWQEGFLAEMVRRIDLLACRRSPDRTTLPCCSNVRSAISIAWRSPGSDIPANNRSTIRPSGCSARAADRRAVRLGTSVFR